MNPWLKLKETTYNIIYDFSIGLVYMRVGATSHVIVSRTEQYFTCLGREA